VKPSPLVVPQVLAYPISSPEDMKKMIEAYKGKVTLATPIPLPVEKITKPLPNAVRYDSDDKEMGMEMTYKEIAELLDIKIKDATNSYYNGMVKLKTLFRDQPITADLLREYLE